VIVRRAAAALIALASLALLLSAALLVTTARWAATSALAATVLTLAAGLVPAWRSCEVFNCVGWVSYTSSDACAAPLDFRTPDWGVGTGCAAGGAAATGPLWLAPRQRYGRPLTIAVAMLALGGVPVASFGPVFRAPGPITLGYVDYAGAVRQSPVGWAYWIALTCAAGVAVLLSARRLPRPTSAPTAARS
jgi:hypothetical protein